MSATLSRVLDDRDNSFPSRLSELVVRVSYIAKSRAGSEFNPSCAAGKYGYSATESLVRSIRGPTRWGGTKGRVARIRLHGGAFRSLRGSVESGLSTYSILLREDDLRVATRRW